MISNQIFMVFSHFLQGPTNFLHCNYLKSDFLMFFAYSSVMKSTFLIWLTPEGEGTPTNAKVEIVSCHIDSAFVSGIQHRFFWYLFSSTPLHWWPGEGERYPNKSEVEIVSCHFLPATRNCLPCEAVSNQILVLFPNSSVMKSTFLVWLTSEGKVSRQMPKSKSFPVISILRSYPESSFDSSGICFQVLPFSGGGCSGGCGSISQQS